MGIEQNTSFCLICLLCEDQRVKTVGRAIYIPLREVEINPRIVLETGHKLSVSGIVCASADVSWGGGGKDVGAPNQQTHRVWTFVR
jgi:hypothetical protein